MDGFRSSSDTKPDHHDGLIGKIQQGWQQVGGFGPAIKGFTRYHINESATGDGIHTWFVELYGAFALVVRDLLYVFSSSGNKRMFYLSVYFVDELHWAQYSCRTGGQDT